MLDNLMNADDSDEIDLGILPPELHEKLRAIATAMECSEEEIVSRMMHLTVNLIKEPDNSELKDFVQKAHEALKSKEIPF